MITGITIFLISILRSEQAKILVIVPSPHYSLQKAYRLLWIALAERGHHITLITTNPMNLGERDALRNESIIMKNMTTGNFGDLGQKPVVEQRNKKGSIRQIDVTNVYNGFKKYNYYELILNFNMSLEQTTTLFRMANACTVELLENPEVKTLIANKTETFDLLMVEYLNPIVLAFTNRFQAPFIGFQYLDAHYMGHDGMGDPTHPVLYPNVNYAGKLTFMERVKCCYVEVATRLFYYIVINNAEYLARQYFGEGNSSLSEQANKLDMYFMISNPLFKGTRPTVPGVYIYMAWILAKENFCIQICNRILIKQHVVYLSLGSNIKSKYLPPQLKKIILETFAELPDGILWKYEDGKPPNVRIMQWLPQQDVLKHPNIEFFISQGGLQSIEEAIFSHVPIIGMPIFEDQSHNVVRIVAKGLGLCVDFKSVTKEDLKAAILEVAGNSQYRENVIELATLSLDKPLSSLEEAVWWTEYVIRHKGAKHLKSPAAHIPIYQYFLLDVIGFVILVIFIMLWVLYN